MASSVTIIPRTAQSMLSRQTRVSVQFRQPELDGSGGASDLPRAMKALRSFATYLHPSPPQEVIRG